MPEPTGSEIVLERIGAWEAVGLIDTATAIRLRSAERVSAPRWPAAPGTEIATATAHRTGIGSAFGPTPTIAEMFTYLGTAFLIAAFTTFLTRIAGNSANRDVLMASGLGLLSMAVIATGWVLADRGERSRRGAGALFVVGVAAAAGAANFVTQVLGWTWGAGPELFVTIVALAVAMPLRWLLPAIATQVGLLGAVTALGGAILDVGQRAIEGRLVDSDGPGYFGYEPRIVDLARDVVLPTAGWLAVALAIGLIGLWEARPRTPAADSRAGISRFWAGMVAVTGAWSGLATSGYLGSDHWGRILEPWLGDLALVVVVAVLVERALRRDTVAYIIPAAIGLIAALTDLNFSYFSTSTEVGLLVEGAILLAVGFTADRVRRRLGHHDRLEPPMGVPPSPPPPSTSPPDASERSPVS